MGRPSEKILIPPISAFVLLAAACLVVSCQPKASQSDTTILEIVARMDPSEGKFLADMRKFYAALAARDWHYTYEGRTSSFKKSVPQELYLSSVSPLTEKMPSFTYEVLASDEFVSDGVKRKRLVMKFDRGAKRPEYSVVWWKYEDGQWRCEEVGMKTVPLFNRFGAQEE